MRITRPTLIASCLLTTTALATATLAAGCTSGAPASTPAATSGPASVTATGADALQTAYENVVTQVLPSVVQINTNTGLGSGVVYDDKGDIVTNAHVVGTATTFQVLVATSGKQLSATLVASFPPSDLAVIKVSDPTGLRPAHFGDSNKLRVGQIVLAMGNPLGLSASVTNGIISATGRTVGEPAPGGVITDAVQTSAAINPGNSGGALVDMAGQVIGVPTLAATDPEIGSAAPGIGFAIPSATVTTLADQMIANGKVTNSGRAALNITSRPVVNANTLQPVGVGVVAVAAGGAADKAGIKPGDIITALNTTATPTSDALNQVLLSLKPGVNATVSLIRSDGSKAQVTVTLGQLS